MAITSGTFTTTTQSPEVSCSKCAIDLTFVGVGGVDVQWKVDGVNWRTIESYTASGQYVYDGVGVSFRLDCTDATADVAWAIRT